MGVQEFDDRRVCRDTDRPTYMVELWSWEVRGDGSRRSLVCDTRVLIGCDVLEALSWCRENQPNPGCFVLYAGTWTNTGHLERLWLTGQAPQSTMGDPRSGAVSYLAAE
ncbi:hypothetical protein [Saccharopolyspora sp. NPDC050642]|uniref:hypothetical protein n=1 Tax=Saccharopolyspora sp. NPDC050642 TaxID=3157099 RepID=UPI0033BFE7A5